MRGAYSGREPGGIEMKTKMNLARGGGRRLQEAPGSIRRSGGNVRGIRRGHARHR